MPPAGLEGRPAREDPLRQQHLHARGRQQLPPVPEDAGEGPGLRQGGVLLEVLAQGPEIVRVVGQDGHHILDPVDQEPAVAVADLTAEPRVQEPEDHDEHGEAPRQEDQGQAQPQAPGPSRSGGHTRVP